MGELIVPPPLRDRHRAVLARYLGGGEPVVLDRRVEITAMRRDGSEFPCELTITRIAQPGDAVFVGHLRDLTERHTAEAELHASRARIVSAAERRGAGWNGTCTTARSSTSRGSGGPLAKLNDREGEVLR